MNSAVPICSAVLMAWLAIAATPCSAAAPGEDPVVLSKPVDYLRLPTARVGTSAGLDTVTDIPVDVKAKIVRFEAKAMAGMPGVATDQDVTTTTTTSSAGMSRTCVQDIASNSSAGAGAFNRFGPSAKDQIVVLKGDLVNVCR